MVLNCHFQNSRRLDCLAYVLIIQYCLLSMFVFSKNVPCQVFNKIWLIWKTFSRKVDFRSWTTLIWKTFSPGLTIKWNIFIYITLQKYTLWLSGCLTCCRPTSFSFCVFFECVRNGDGSVAKILIIHGLNGCIWCLKASKIDECIAFRIPRVSVSHNLGWQTHVFRHITSCCRGLDGWVVTALDYSLRGKGFYFCPDLCIVSISRKINSKRFT